ncbi:MAG: hypothetical protein ACREJC_04245, partial [Tepidisphaeraceae bacterium]
IVWIGAVVQAVATAAWGGTFVVPGTPSYVDMRIHGEVVANGITIEDTYDHSAHLLVGTGWPGESNPPFVGAWTLDDFADVRDGDTHSYVRTYADYSYSYGALQTSLRLKSHSQGFSSDPGTSLGDDRFAGYSHLSGYVEMWLTTDDPDPDLDAEYTVTLVARISGSELYANGDPAHATVDHFTRVDPLGGGVDFDFIGAYTDLAPPPLNPGGDPTYLIEQSVEFTGIHVNEPFANVFLGVGLAPALLTQVEGATALPAVLLSEARSMFDSTLQLQFTAVLVPEPGVAVVAAALLAGAMRRRRLVG